MNKALAIVDQETPAPKKKREKIRLIETQPEADWFVQAKTKRGRRIWYLRFSMTGWNPRLYGPFQSKHQCLLFLDHAIGLIQETESEAVSDAYDRRLRQTCAHAWLPIIEHPACGKGKSGKNA